jgi:hypothetical protein
LARPRNATRRNVARSARPFRRHSRIIGIERLAAKNTLTDQDARQVEDASALRLGALGEGGEESVDATMPREPTVGVAANEPAMGPGETAAGPGAHPQGFPCWMRPRSVQDAAHVNGARYDGLSA